MVGALVEFAIVVLLNRVPTTRAEYEENGRNPRRVYNSAKTRNQQAWSEDGRVITRKATSKSCKENQRFSYQKKARIFAIPSMNEIDFAAFWVYFVLYLLFNCVYWIQYL